MAILLLALVKIVSTCHKLRREFENAYGSFNMNGGMTECGRCDCDPCVCDKERIKISDIFHTLEGSYTLEYKIYLIRKGMLIALTRISDKISKIKAGDLQSKDVELLERLITAEEEILHPDKWWQFWK